MFRVHTKTFFLLQNILEASPAKFGFKRIHRYTHKLKLVACTNIINFSFTDGAYV